MAEFPFVFDGKETMIILHILDEIWFFDEMGRIVWSNYPPMMVDILAWHLVIIIASVVESVNVSIFFDYKCLLLLVERGCSG